MNKLKLNFLFISQLYTLIPHNYKFFLLIFPSSKSINFSATSLYLSLYFFPSLSPFPFSSSFSLPSSIPSSFSSPFSSSSSSSSNSSSLLEPGSSCLSSLLSTSLFIPEIAFKSLYKL